ncbi:MAG: hypothetical protein KJ749_14720, partial [Planctomycetes bacterium]|nr:hypothetical protein [Planctomycetota bacterium]
WPRHPARPFPFGEFPIDASAPDAHIATSTDAPPRASSAEDPPGGHTAVAAAATPCYAHCMLSNGA